MSAILTFLNNGVEIPIPALQGEGMNVTGATVGQIAQIAAVDANGKPTAWSPVDLPSGGGSSEEVWETVANVTLEEEVSEVSYEFGKTVKHIALYVWCPASAKDNTYIYIGLKWDTDDYFSEVTSLGGLPRTVKGACSATIDFLNSDAAKVSMMTNTGSDEHVFGAFNPQGTFAGALMIRKPKNYLASNTATPNGMKAVRIRTMASEAKYPVGTRVVILIR